MTELQIACLKVSVLVTLVLSYLGQIKLSAVKKACRLQQTLQTTVMILI